MNKKIAFLTLGVVIVCGLLVVALTNRKTATDSDAELFATNKDTQNAALALRLIEQSHTQDWSGADELRIQSVRVGKPLSKGDFEWMINKLHLKNQDQGAWTGIVTTIIPSFLAADTTHQQQKALQDVGLPMLSMNDAIYNDGNI